MVPWANNCRISPAVSSTAAWSGAGRAASARMAPASPFASTKARYASVVTTNPAGTGKPALTSSPRLAPLPPARSRSPRPKSVRFST